ncbi:hypothetical protein DENSPDRAFT_541596 [Dentipellis sp. KUC8613]|nr:hypothetical protein DENSPDRAFT_541596 [Dentipellis sp. KUC8613]
MGVTRVQTVARAEDRGRVDTSGASNIRANSPTRRRRTTRLARCISLVLDFTSIKVLLQNLYIDT